VTALTIEVSHAARTCRGEVPFHKSSMLADWRRDFRIVGY
jgi:hypothetical protein